MSKYIADQAFDLKDRVKEKVMEKTGSKFLIANHSQVNLEISVPEWGFVFLGIIAMLIVLSCAYALIRKLFGKKRHGEKNKSKGFKGFFKSGGATGPTDFMTIDKLQPDLDALQENMEQNEKEQAEEKEVVNLGRIQYKLDYEFQQGQVVSS
jgi:synaptotagmin-1